MNLEKIHLTENQWKVIKDKYLQNDTPEQWLHRIAENIALAEILYCSDGPCYLKRKSSYVDTLEIFKDVDYQIKEFKFYNDLTSYAILLHSTKLSALQRDKNFSQFIKNLYNAKEKNPEIKKLINFYTEKFYKLLSRFDFLPNSPTLMNAGRSLQQLSACYVLPVDDSMEAITNAVKSQALIHKSGGGTGFSFGRIRPAGDEVKTTKGVASGAISFMQIFDKMTDVVKQGGTRRGANMGILPYWHPEIKEFIKLKSNSSVMENFNISVAVDEKFINCVMENSQYALINPRTKKIEGYVNAKEVFDAIIENAWKSGDPGIIFIDRINSSNSNPIPAIGLIEATNPCGEQPLLPFEACNLGSINLNNFVNGEIGKGKIDFERLIDTVDLAVRFLDNVIDVNNYPLQEIEYITKMSRRIGLGVMGFAEFLVRLGIPYDSEEAIETARKIMSFINTQALKSSENLAKERGVFPYWKDSIYDQQSTYYKETYFPRNSARTTIAPTGTIALAAGLQGSGIEPFFAISYRRYNANGLDAIKENKIPKPEDTFIEVNPLFKELAEKNNLFGLSEDDLFQKIEKNHSSVKGIKEIPLEIQRLFPTAHDINYEIHVKIQAAFQEFTDNAVSKTINLPNSATIEDVKNAYLLAYKYGCKGITIYRDGSKSRQVLNLTKNQTPKNQKQFFRSLRSEYYEIPTGYGPLHVHIDYDETGPKRVFLQITPLGTEISGLTSIMGILLSKYLEAGGDAVRILKHLSAVKGDRPWGFGPNRVDSIPHAVGIALKAHLKSTGLLKEEPKNLELWDASKVSYCPKCFSTNISFQSGCKGPVCHDCGYSECT